LTERLINILKKKAHEEFEEKSKKLKKAEGNKQKKSEDDFIEE